jgi:Ala-tRNA(Pro) deacylase
MMSSQDNEGPTDTIVQFLEASRIAYELIEHEPVTSAAAEARVAGRAAEEVAKTVVLHDGSACVIAVIPASRRLDLHKLRELLGATRQLRLASEEEIERDFPALEVGAVPPFGPMIPAAEVIDRDLTGWELILCPAGDHRHSVLVSPREIVRLTGATTADISED